MKSKVSPLFSNYILEGMRMDETPFSALLDVLDGEGTVNVPSETFGDVIDEYLDKAPAGVDYEFSKIDDYCQAVLRASYDKRRVNLDYPVSWTIAAVNSLLLDAIFRSGHFELQNLMLMAKWDWNNAPAGNLAAFYDSTVTMGHYLFDLGLKLDRYFVEENRRGCFLDLTIRSDISSRRRCPDRAVPPSDTSEIIYIPFCAGRYSLGGSALCAVTSSNTGAEPDLYDPDYFIDCYEVVRELVEDGIILAGAPVGRGGLMASAEKFRGRCGLTINLDGIMSAVSEKDPVRILFSEIPGVLLQISSSDLEYVDSQLLLQEIAYYPFGPLATDFSSVRCTYGRDEGLASILGALVRRNG